jgi:hypothetical protein
VSGRLPPFARRLVELDLAGVVPDRVFVWLAASDKWPDTTGFVHSIVLPMAGYVPGAYDLRVCAAVPVFLVDDAHVPEADMLSVLAALATVSPVVTVVELDQRGELLLRDASEVLFTARAPDPLARVMRWPPGWSDQLDHDYHASQRAYRDFERTHLAA